MKNITRTCTIYYVTIANIDVATAKAVNVQTFYFNDKPTRTQINKLCKDNNNAVVINREEKEIKCSIPVSYFIEACKAYAEEAAARAEADHDPHEDQ